MRVPPDAAPGPATLLVELESETGKVGVPTRIPAQVEAPEPPAGEASGDE